VYTACAFSSLSCVFKDYSFPPFCLFPLLSSKKQYSGSQVLQNGVGAINYVGYSCFCAQLDAINSSRKRRSQFQPSKFTIVVVLEFCFSVPQMCSLLFCAGPFCLMGFLGDKRINLIFEDCKDNEQKCTIL